MGYEIKQEVIQKRGCGKGTILPDARAGCMIIGMAANAVSSSKAVTPVPLHVPASPSVRKWVREKGIRFTRMKGTGKFRRIIRKDVLKEEKKILPACVLMTIAVNKSI